MYPNTVHAMDVKPLLSYETPVSQDESYRLKILTPNAVLRSEMIDLIHDNTYSGFTYNAMLEAGASLSVDQPENGLLIVNLRWNAEKHKPFIALMLNKFLRFHPEGRCVGIEHVKDDPNPSCPTEIVPVNQFHDDLVLLANQQYTARSEHTMSEQVAALIAFHYPMDRGMQHLSIGYRVAVALFQIIHEQDKRAALLGDHPYRRKTEVWLSEVFDGIKDYSVSVKTDPQFNTFLQDVEPSRRTYISKPPQLEGSDHVTV